MFEFESDFFTSSTLGSGLRVDFFVELIRKSIVCFMVSNYYNELSCQVLSTQENNSIFKKKNNWWSVVVTKKKSHCFRFFTFLLEGEFFFQRGGGSVCVKCALKRKCCPDLRAHQCGNLFFCTIVFLTVFRNLEKLKITRYNHFF